MKIKKDKIIEFLSKVFFLTAQHAFFACLVLFALALVFGIFLFYQCDILVNTTKFDDLEEPFSLKRKVYETVLNNWQADEKRFEEAGSKEYINPFSGGELTPLKISPAL